MYFRNFWTETARKEKEERNMDEILCRQVFENKNGKNSK